MIKNNKKKSLSKKRILQVAVKYADEHGIESINMRKLAQLLDTGAMSIYYYFKNKDELLDAMVEWVAAKIIQPKTEGNWKDNITDIATSAHIALMQHAWVNKLWSTRTLGPNKLAYMESILRTLRTAGFSVSLSCDAYHAIITHIEGFTLHAVQFPVTSSNAQSVARAFLDSIEDPESIPFFIEHVKHHMEKQSCGDQFGTTLKIILDGFEERLNKLV